MIETVGDLLKLLHKWPSTKRLQISHRGETSQLSGITRQEGDELIFESIHKHKLPADKPGHESSDSDTADLPDDAAEAVEQCDHILTLCDDVPERAEGFAADIADKVSGVREWIVENKHVTPKQLSALEGWEAGISKWIS